MRLDDADLRAIDRNREFGKRREVLDATGTFEQR